MKNYSVLHSAGTHKHQHGFIAENFASHVHELMLELGRHIEHCENRFDEWLRAAEKFFIILFRDKKLLTYFCGMIISMIIVVIAIAQLIAFIF